LQSTTRNCFVLFLGCLLFHIAGTWIMPLIDRDEPRFAEASREMMERGDYVVPYFNNQYRFDKPPLTYWAQVATYRIFGDNDFAARFPSAVAAGLTAVVLLAWGTRIGLARAGWWAAIIFTLSLQVFEHGKAAVADMWLVLFVTLAHWAGYEMVFHGKRIQRSTPNAQRPTLNEESQNHVWLWWWVFYLSLAFAFLAKGPIGWTPLATVGIAVLILRPQRDAQSSFPKGSLLTVAGLIIMFGVVSLWGIPALQRTHGQFFQIGIGRHVVGRSFSAIGGHGANSLVIYFLLLPFYFATVFVSFFPWSLKLPWLTKKLRGGRGPIDVYLITGALIVFGIFTFVTTKLLHYTLPAFPLLALLLARALDREPASEFVRRCAWIAAPVYLALALFASPFVAHFFPARELFRQCQRDLQPNMEFGAVEFNEPSVVWYFRKRLKTFMTLLDRKNVGSFMAEEGPRLAILPSSAAGKIFFYPPADWKVFTTRGFNVVKGKRSDLTLILKPE
jgi:4-amino-4-deoxy-L-arabinose transferase-like glycosyltransferase